jgi:hypothetical protein
MVLKKFSRLRLEGRCRRIVRAPLSIAAALALLSVSLITNAAGQGSFKIESAGPPRPEIRQQLRNRLEVDGTRLLRTVNGVDIPLAELWWARSLTVHGFTKTSISEYVQLAPGKLLAILYLPAALEDVNHQKVPQGFYTLRYAHFDPEKDTHEKGEDKHDDAEYRDYVFLANLESGRQPGEYVGFPEMLKLSRQVSSGKKPAMLALLPLNPAYRTFPYVVSDDKGRCAVQFKVPVHPTSGRAEEIRIAILLVNPPNVSEED